VIAEPAGYDRKTALGFAAGFSFAALFAFLAQAIVLGFPIS
jgi:hypothetical protein